MSDNKYDSFTDAQLNEEFAVSVLGYTRSELPSGAFRIEKSPLFYTFRMREALHDVVGEIGRAAVIRAIVQSKRKPGEAFQCYKNLLEENKLLTAKLALAESSRLELEQKCHAKTQGGTIFSAVLGMRNQTIKELQEKLSEVEKAREELATRNVELFARQRIDTQLLREKETSLKQARTNFEDANTTAGRYAVDLQKATKEIDRLKGILDDAIAMAARRAEEKQSLENRLEAFKRELTMALDAGQWMRVDPVIALQLTAGDRVLVKGLEILQKHVADLRKNVTSKTPAFTSKQLDTLVREIRYTIAQFVGQNPGPNNLHDELRKKIVDTIERGL